MGTFDRPGKGHRKVSLNKVLRENKTLVNQVNALQKNLNLYYGITISLASDMYLYNPDSDIFSSGNFFTEDTLEKILVEADKKLKDFDYEVIRFFNKDKERIDYVDKKETARNLDFMLKLMNVKEYDEAQHLCATCKNSDYCTISDGDDGDEDFYVSVDDIQINKELNQVINLCKKYEVKDDSSSD